MMLKNIILSLLITIFFISMAHAGEVKLTTYYPAPYGEYEEIKTKKDTYLATDTGSKVGIGTTTPQATLDITSEVGVSNAGSETLYGIRSAFVKNGGGSNIIYGHYLTPNYYGGGGSQTMYGLYVKPWYSASGNVGGGSNKIYGIYATPGYSGGGGSNKIYGLYVEPTYSGAGGSNELYSAVFKGGNVGIGTDTPSRQLVINGENPSILFEKQSKGKWEIGDTTNNDNFSVYANGGAGLIMHMQHTSGNVGIGTTNPQAKLDVVSTTSGFLPPRLTNGQMNSMPSAVEGTIIYNTTSHQWMGRTDTGWVPIGGGGLEYIGSVDSGWVTKNATVKPPAGTRVMFLEGVAFDDNSGMQTNGSLKVYVKGQNSSGVKGHIEVNKYNGRGAAAWACFK